MKKAVFGIVVIAILLGAGKLLTSKSPPSANQNLASRGKQITKNTIDPSPTTHSPLVTSQSLFIPYWSSKIDSQEMSYDNYYYFGISPTAMGKIASEVGLHNIPLVEIIPEKKKKLVLRMLDASVTETILTNTDAQNRLITETNTLLSEKSFSGIVLDLEVPFTLQPTKKDQITRFVQQICSAIKANYRTCDLLVYGDYSYRNRPYDLKSIEKSVDGVLLMAYDFHKTSGEPGPNFPFNEKKKYGYDFKTMISDALALIPKEKIEVVFGMYGYDWTLNEQGTPLKSAEALSVNEIRQRVAQNANRENDTRYTLHENEAKEKSIQYIDGDSRSHIIWYEDEESTTVKTKYLLEQGVSRVSFWAHSYF